MASAIKSRSGGGPADLELINAYQMRQMDAAEKDLYK
jgi:hypothetical protein